MLHPVLQFYQLALQAEQFLEVEPPLDGRLGGQSGQLVGQRVKPLIVEFEFEFLVETVLHLRAKAVEGGGPFGHGKLQFRMRNG